MAWEGVLWKYAGKNKWKGLGIIWKEGEGEFPRWYNLNLCYAIPLLLKDTLILASNQVNFK